MYFAPQNLQSSKLLEKNETVLKADSNIKSLQKKKKVFLPHIFKALTFGAMKAFSIFFHSLCFEQG